MYFFTIHIFTDYLKVHQTDLSQEDFVYGWRECDRSVGAADEGTPWLLINKEPERVVDVWESNTDLKLYLTESQARGAGARYLRKWQGERKRAKIATTGKRRKKIQYNIIGRNKDY